MNARGKTPAKKIVFEPKIPEKTSESPVLSPEKSDISATNPVNSPQEVKPSQKMKGIYAPKTFSTPKDFNIETNQFLINLPDSIEECSLVQFDDGSFGVKSNGKIFECDTAFINESLVVDLDEKAKKVGFPEFILTVYPYSSENS